MNQIHPWRIDFIWFLGVCSLHYGLQWADIWMELHSKFQICVWGYPHKKMSSEV